MTMTGSVINITFLILALLLPPEPVANFGGLTLSSSRTSVIPSPPFVSAMSSSSSSGSSSADLNNNATTSSGADLIFLDDEGEECALPSVASDLPNYERFNDWIIVQVVVSIFFFLLTVLVTVKQKCFTDTPGQEREWIFVANIVRMFGTLVTSIVVAIMMFRNWSTARGQDAFCGLNRNSCNLTVVNGKTVKDFDFHLCFLPPVNSSTCSNARFFQEATEGFNPGAGAAGGFFQFLFQLLAEIVVICIETRQEETIKRHTVAWGFFSKVFLFLMPFCWTPSLFPLQQIPYNLRCIVATPEKAELWFDIAITHFIITMASPWILGGLTVALLCCSCIVDREDHSSSSKSNEPTGKKKSHDDDIPFLWKVIAFLWVLFPGAWTVGSSIAGFYCFYTAYDASFTAAQVLISTGLVSILRVVMSLAIFLLTPSNLKK